MTDFHQALLAVERHFGMGREDGFGGLARPGHRTGEGLLDRHGAQEVGRGVCLGQTGGVEGNVDLSLEATLAVPVGFAVAHQQQACPWSLGRQSGAQVSGDIERFDLHLHAADLTLQVEHREEAFSRRSPWKRLAGSPSNCITRQRRMALWATTSTVVRSSPG